MKIYLKLPNGAEFIYEREPMTLEKLGAVCATICVVTFFTGLFGIFIF